MASLKFGPVGPSGFEEWDHHGLTQIVQILVFYTPQFLRSLQFQYLENGRLHTSSILGCKDLSVPQMFNTITFQDGNEHIRKVEGFYGFSHIEKLCIHTNKKSYEIFKAENPTLAKCRERFSFDFGGENQFGGFHGTHTPGGVCSIGVYINRLFAVPAAFIGDEEGAKQDNEDGDQCENNGVIVSV